MATLQAAVTPRGRVKFKKCSDCGKEKLMLPEETNCGCVKTRERYHLALRVWELCKDYQSATGLFDVLENERSNVQLGEIQYVLARLSQINLMDAITQDGVEVFRHVTITRKQAGIKNPRKMLEGMIKQHIR